MPIALIDCDAALLELTQARHQEEELALRPHAVEGLERLAWRADVAVLLDPPSVNRLLPRHTERCTRRLRAALAPGGHRPPILRCRHLRSDPRCACRKPGGGLIEEARRILPGGRRAHGWLIGGREADVRAGRAASLLTVIVGSRARLVVGAAYHAHDLLDAANWILLQEALEAEPAWPFVAAQG